MMNIIIPYYGKQGTIRSVKQIDDINFEVETYKNNGDSSITSNVTVIKEQILKNYLTDIKGYLNEWYQEYEEFKDNVENKKELKKTLSYLFGGIAGLIGIPALAVALQMNDFVLGITIANTLLMAPTIINSSKELIFGENRNFMKEFVNEYETVLEEEKQVEQELEQIRSKKETKFTTISPKKEQVQEKKLVKEKMVLPKV